MEGIRCMVMRGGTSKGLYFLASDLPANEAQRDLFLLAAMGSPDPLQIDGMGGASPLTSKAAIISPSSRNDADVDYLFLQVVVDQARVDPSQNCGNILAGVAAFAVERHLVPPQPGKTTVRIHMVNTASIAAATITTREAKVIYSGNARIDGVPGSAAPVLLEFLDVAGSTCGALFPTGNSCDMIDGVKVTCIDNGMPVVLLRAEDLGLNGYEAPSDLENDAAVKARIERIRLLCGLQMNLGDVAHKSVPKMCLVAPPLRGGTISTRTFIPRRVHQSIGVLGAVSVATACAVPGTVAARIAALPDPSERLVLDVEHPTGFLTVQVSVCEENGVISVHRSSLLRTARKLMDGYVYAAEPMETRA